MVSCRCPTSAVSSKCVTIACMSNPPRGPLNTGVVCKCIFRSWWRHQLETFPRYWPFVMGIHRSPTKACDTELWCFLWSVPEQTVEKTVDIPVIWDATNAHVTSLRVTKSIATPPPPPPPPPHLLILSIFGIKKHHSYYIVLISDMCPAATQGLSTLSQKLRTSFGPNMFNFVTTRGSFPSWWATCSSIVCLKNDIWATPGTVLEETSIHPFNPCDDEFITRINIDHGPLARYIKLRVAHALGMPGTFSSPPRFSDPDMHHGTCITARAVMHAGIAN